MKLKKMGGFVTAMLGAMALLATSAAWADDKADAKKSWRIPRPR